MKARYHDGQLVDRITHIEVYYGYYDNITGIVTIVNRFLKDTEEVRMSIDYEEFLKWSNNLSPEELWQQFKPWSVSPKNS